MQIEPGGPRFKAIHRAGALEVEIPARRSWFTVLFLSVWMFGWFVGEVTVIQKLMHPDGKNSYAFLVAWLAGWTLGGTLAAISLVWQVSGRELLLVSSSNLLYRIEALGIGVSRSYRPAEIKDLRVVAGLQAPAGRQAGFSIPGLSNGVGTVAFDYGGRTVKLAPGLDEAESKSLLMELEANLPRKREMAG